MKFLKRINKDSSHYIEKILVFLFFVSILFINLYPLQNGDTFFHLKTGEWIWQHNRLPDEDPFTFTVDADIYKQYKRPYYLLKGYWLSQLIIYGFYSFLGIYGIIIFRCLISLVLIFLLYFWMRKKGISQIITLFFLIPSLVVVFTFGDERPNTLSYIMAVLVFYILDEYICKGKRKGLLLPVVMLIWSVMHGGFLLGEVLIGIYLIVILYRLLKRELSFKTEGFKIVTLFVSIVLPFLIKVNWYTLMTMFEDSPRKYIAEWTNPFFQTAHGDFISLALIVFMILLILVIIKKLSIEHVLSAIFLIVISFNAIRYIPFLVLLMTPIVSLHWTTRPTFNVNNKLFRYSIYTAIFFCVILVGQKGYKRSVFLKGLISDQYPDDAAKFIKAVKPEGNMFNNFGWGGYLIYSLYPEKKVFIDTRGFSLPVVKKYIRIIKGFTGKQEDCLNNMPMWKALLYEYNIEIVLLLTYEPEDGRFTMLIKRLMDDPEWSLVFIGNKNPDLIFLKNTTRNQQIIQKYSVPKKLAYEKAFEDLMHYHTAKRDHWRYLLQIGLINIFLNKYIDASKYFEKALEKNNRLAETSVSRILWEIKNNGNMAINDEELYKIWSY